MAEDMLLGIGWRQDHRQPAVYCVSRKVKEKSKRIDLELIVQEILFLSKEVDKAAFSGWRGILPGLLILYARKFPEKIMQIVPGDLHEGFCLIQQDQRIIAP